jgi:hypothetical protein
MNEIMNLTIPQFFMFRQCQTEQLEARDKARERAKIEAAFNDLRSRR